MTNIETAETASSDSFLGRLLPTWELLHNLTVRELKIRYKRSAIGFLWTLLNPLLMMAVFTVVFTTAFKAPIKDFPLFFLCGYLPWAFFQASAQVSTGVIVGNASLIKKVWFPRIVLPLSVVLSQLVHLLLALLVLMVALGLDGYNFLPYAPALLAGLVLLTLFTAGMSMAFAAANTMYRDIQEFSNVLFLLWFYMTPVVYALTLLPKKYQLALHANPMYYFISMIRSPLYELRYPSLGVVIGSLLWTAVALIGGTWLFQRLSVRFAKEI
ncbi:MAG: lipopolysaccharide transport system permease protein [Acidimicrobiaceae bacterium]